MFNQNLANSFRFTRRGVSLLGIAYVLLEKSLINW